MLRSVARERFLQRASSDEAPWFLPAPAYTFPVYAVYIMTNPSRHPFYTGFSGRVTRRAFEHKHHARGGFTARYNLHRLVYVELFYDPYAAIAREKQIQGWTRAKKIALIEAQNPKWDDLARDWDKVWKPRRPDLKPSLLPAKA